MTLRGLQCPRYAFYGFQSPNWGSFNYISINYAKNKIKYIFIIRKKLKIPYMKKKIKEVGVFIYHIQTTKNKKIEILKKKKNQFRCHYRCVMGFSLTFGFQMRWGYLIWCFKKKWYKMGRIFGPLIWILNLFNFSKFV